ncbi:Uncharacterized protein Cc8K152 [Caligus rogercresseyi]|uniref:Uncharacterized protein Cc8K152 n=1 Tax=Caligus rogercresseyi TaxID=217165 RepID=A0A7T8KH73_CALRO|nr:Uncharacterized protein Cc8K152 [Caligus rogercresseyi]
MGAVIYVLKMIICGEKHVKVGQAKFKGLLDLGFFFLGIYARYWFASPVAADAPFLTWSMWHDLQRWKSRDKILATKAQEKLELHTWYLTGRAMFYLFFSRLVEDSLKRILADTLLLPENAPCEIPPGKPDLPKITEESSLEDFVNSETWLLPQLVKIHPTFLHLPVNEWPNDDSYVKLREIVTSLRVVNDAAERSVKFGTDFTQVMTKSEDSRQNILQTVELARRAFPRATRKVFLATPATSSTLELMKAAHYDARESQS